MARIFLNYFFFYMSGINSLLYIYIYTHTPFYDLNLEFRIDPSIYIEN